METDTSTHSMGRLFRDAIVVTVVSMAIGLAANLVHPEPIPYVALQAYEVTVPCPEPGGEVLALEPNDPTLFRDDTIVIDARSERVFLLWHMDGAVNVPFDYLDPTPQDTLQNLARKIAASGARRVIVYGDGDAPDTGEQLGKEISGYGIRNVFFLRGGAPALTGVDGKRGAP